MRKQKTEYRVGVGASSILMILVVLALTALSLLSFSGARNAQVLAKRNVDMVTTYYQAAANVQKKLAALDDAVSAFAETAKAEAAAASVSALEPDITAAVSDGAKAPVEIKIPSAEQVKPVAPAIPQTEMERFTAELAKRGLDDVKLKEKEGQIEFLLTEDAGHRRVLQVAGTLSWQGTPRYQVIYHRLTTLPMRQESSPFQLMQPMVAK